jgi:hypothetical protein
MTEQFANLAQSSLAAAIDDEQTHIYVANASTFPASGNFRIVVQTFDASGNTPINQPEIMLVTAVGGNGGFTVTRAAEAIGGVQQAYAFRSGAKVTHIVTAGVMQALEAGGGGGGISSINGDTTSAQVIAGGTGISVSTTSGTTTITATGSGTGTVTTTGTPASGNLAKFSGSTSITNGNLSGDVTTSGTLATTVAAIQGTTVSGTTGIPHLHRHDDCRRHLGIGGDFHERSGGSLNAGTQPHRHPLHGRQRHNYRSL